MTTEHDVTIELDPDLPLVRVTREFEAPPDKVFRAHADPDLVARWLGPHGYELVVDTWVFRPGGEYRYRHLHEGEEYAFRGCVHDVVPSERIVQTFTFEGMPESVSLDTTRFEELPGGRTRLIAESLVDSMEARDAFVASGMETGIRDSYERLDGVLAR